MKKINFFTYLMAAVFFIASCSEDKPYEENSESPESSSLINKKGEIDGLSYSLKDVEVNPEVIMVNEENASLVSMKGDSITCTITLASVSHELSKSLLIGNVLYICTDTYAGIHKIEKVQVERDSYILETSQAQLGEVFQGGTMDLSLDLGKASRALAQKKQDSRGALSQDYFSEILDINDTYNCGGFDYSPTVNVKMNLSSKIDFSRKQLLPSQVSVIFELQTVNNYLLNFAGPASQDYNKNTMDYLSKDLLNSIKSQEFDINIPIYMFGIRYVPAKFKITDVRIPTEIRANIFRESNFECGMSGGFKMGYIMDITGFKGRFTPVSENNLSVLFQGIPNLHGELYTQSDIIITPKISILWNAFSISSDITFGMKTESNGDIEVAPGITLYGSKGTFISKMDFLLNLVIAKFPIQGSSNEVPLWDLGTVDKTVTYANLMSNVTSKYTTNVFARTRSYETYFQLYYNYLIPGKKIPDVLYISYDVYDVNLKSKLESVIDKTIFPANVTANSFTFHFPIPFKKDGIKYQTTSYLKNIVIRDRYGYTYQGIYDSVNNTVQNSVAIYR